MPKLLDCFAETLRVIDRSVDEAVSIALSIGKDSVFATWNGCVPWTDEAGEDLPGVVALFRRVGKAYELDRGDIKVRGYDPKLLMRTSDALKGKLHAQMIVEVQSRANPDEPPVKYMVRMLDEHGDGNVDVYLLNLNPDGTPEEEEEEEGRGRRPGYRGDRQGDRRRRW